MDPTNACDLMLECARYRDCCAGNCLAQGLDIVANHPGVSEDTSWFIKKHFYVDDGGLSSPIKQKLEWVISELPPALQRYSFDIKHILKSYEESTGITNSETDEQILGLVWNFIQDTLCPTCKFF